MSVFEKGAKVPAEMARGGRGNLNLSGFLSARRGYSRTLPPLLRQGGGREIRWDGRAPAENIAKNVQAQNNGSLSEFVAAKQHPTNLRTQFPPQLATNEAARFHDNPQNLDPAADAPARESYAPKTASHPDLLALQKGMNETRNLMFKNMSPTDKANYLLRQYYERTSVAEPKKGNKKPSKR